MAGFCWNSLTRRKVLDSLDLEDSKLARVLNTFDLTALGVGSTLGVGVYVIAGNVAKNIAGPAVVVSFLIAAIASVFAGLCYAEFGARVPKAGSAYVYSYVCVGEFVAFVIGWNLILEYVIGSASVARGMSLYIDTLIGGKLQQTFLNIAPLHLSFLSEYFDFLSFTMAIFLSVLLAFGVKKSSVMNNIFTITNVGVVLFVIIAGSFVADVGNWSIEKKDLPEGASAGEGGFLPFGVAGAIKGAATCFYGFVGFDCIATTGEEVKNPARAIPIAIIISLAIIFISYFGVSTVLTMMLPYYLQDEYAPIPSAFQAIGWPVARWIVAIGAIFGLCSSLFGAMFPLPRVIYAMSCDGLLFESLGRVHPRFQTPMVGTIVAGLLTGVMAAMFELEQLVNMMSIGTLLAYTIVAACVLLLRYSCGEGRNEEGYALVDTNVDTEAVDTDSDDTEYKYNLDEFNRIINPEYIRSVSMQGEEATFGNVSRQLFNCRRLRVPQPLSSKIVTVHIVSYCTLSIVLSLCVVQLQDELWDLNPWALSVVGSLTCLLLLILLSIAMQPKSTKFLTFKVPLVPLIPAVSILVNIYLMVMLDSNTWIRFGIWMSLGMAVYFGFSIWSSKERQVDGKKFMSSYYRREMLSYSSEE